MSGASELVEGREVFDPFLNKTVKVSDKLTDRLRGRYAIGPTMDNGEPEFGWREFTAPPIQHEAAAELARLSSAHSEAVEDARKHLAELSASQAEVVALREALVFYADEANWTEPEQANRQELFDTEMGKDLGTRARATLAGEKPVGAGVETKTLRTALLAVVAATRAYLPPDGIDAQECLNRILAATDNPTINPYILEAEHGRS